MNMRLSSPFYWIRLVTRALLASAVPQRVILVLGMMVWLQGLALAVDKVLILDSTVQGGFNSVEAKAATDLGYQVELVTGATWKGMSASAFAGYRALILGDPVSGIAAITDAEMSAATWASVVNGNVIIFGGDPVNHPPGGHIFTTNAVRFATDQAGKTGLYVSLSRYYEGAGANTLVSVLDKLSPPDHFRVHGAQCWNDSHILLDHPSFLGLDDAALSNWSCSSHEVFDAWPVTYSALAIAEGVPGGAYTAADGSVGGAYVLARGEGLAVLTNRIKLTPVYAENPTNSTHTVCATFKTNGIAYAGASVSFSVLSGPNAGATGTETTDASGVACFTYTGSGGVGTDSIQAQGTTPQGAVVLSSSVRKGWFDPCGSTLPRVHVVEASCGTNVATVYFNKIVNASEASQLSHYSISPGITLNSVSYMANSYSAQLFAAQNFTSGTTYTLSVQDLHDLCGNPMSPNPYTFSFSCLPDCQRFQCPSNITADCEGPGGAIVDYPSPTVEPGCPGTTFICNPPSHSLFPPGTTTVTCISTNSTNSCTFTVTVADQLPPEIHCPSNLVVYSACPDARVPFIVTATDNCCTNPTVVCTPPSYSLFSAGTTTPVHCVATDCSGNTNSCDFTVEVIEISPTNGLALSFCPSNILICTSNGCGLMPDATTQVQASDGGATVFISQSIPPGTRLCADATVTFAITNACGEHTNCTARVTVTNCCCVNPTLIEWPSAPGSITIWERTGQVLLPHTFSLNPVDARLSPIPGGPSAGTNDFHTDDGEFYDVYFSDAAGTPDAFGCCVTLLCNQSEQLSNYDSGNNIDAVEVNFADGSRLGAASVGSVQLGQGIDDPVLLYTTGQASSALGLHDGAWTSLGYGTSRITLCFSARCPRPVSIQTSWTWAANSLVLYWPDIGHRTWEVLTSANLTGPWGATGITNPPVTNTPIDRTKFYKLRWLPP